MIKINTFDPVAFSIFALDVRWYALAYVAGLLFAFFYIPKIDKEKFLSYENLDSLMFYLMLPAILGGRLGYVFIYNFSYYMQEPAEILKIWNGGMSFHGGIIGGLIGLYMFSRFKNIPFGVVTDLCSCALPFGLFLGRIANFINGELYGRMTDVPWAVFVNGSKMQEGRHPSQLYEAFFEGLVLLFILYILSSRTAIRKIPGILSCIMIALYSFMRFILEFFREPDIQIGFILKYFTLGQVLSVIVFLIASLCIFFFLKREKYAR